MAWIDGSIPAMVQTARINTPFENLSQLLHVQQQRAQLAEQDDLNRQRREQEQERQRAIAEQQGVRDLIASMSANGQPVTPETLIPALQARGMGDTALKIQSQLETQQKTRADTLKATLENHEKAIGIAGKLLNGVQDEASWQAVRPQITHLFGSVNPALLQGVPETYDAQRIGAMRDGAMTAADRLATQRLELDKSKFGAEQLKAERDATPKAGTFEDYLGRIAQDQQRPVSTLSAADVAKARTEFEATGRAPEKTPGAGTFEDYLARLAAEQRRPVQTLSPADVRKAKAEFEAAGRAPDKPEKERLVQVMRNGAPIWVKESEAIGQPAAQAARAVTGIERQSLAFYNRAQEADTTAAPLETAIGKMGLASQGRLQYAPNFLQSPENQSYRQAQRAFTEARLRKESGAAIPLSEYENDARTYFAQPGDTPATIEQKRKARQTVLKGLAFSSGKAYDEFYGEPLDKSGTLPAAPQSGALTYQDYLASRGGR